MFINPSDYRSFLRTQAVLKLTCKGKSPTSCKDYEKFYSSFKVNTFEDETTQSFVGVLSYKKNKNILAVFKISREEDNVILNEYDILRQLDRAAKSCPHFVKVFGLCRYLGDIDIKPITSLRGNSATIDRPLLLIEYVHSVGDMYRFIDAVKKTAEQTLISLIAQTLMALRIMHQVGITHNDIHCHNILIKKCAPDICLKYIFKSKEYMIPTFGYFPIIIDFGLGRSAPEEDMPLLGSFCFTHYGFSSDEFTPNIDYIRFLSAIRYGTKDKFPTISKWCTKHLKTIRGIDKEIGWNNFYKYSVIEVFCNKICSVFPDIRLLSETLWIENLQLLIKRPIEEMGAQDISVFAGFFNNWMKFEERINSMAELNYIFKSFVFSVKLWRNDYLKQDPAAVERIKLDFIEKYEKVIQFHCPSVNYDDMICSLILGASYMEGFFFNHLKRLTERCPKRKGILAGKDCDETIWKSFYDTFGCHLGLSKNVKIKSCHLFDL